MQLIRGDLWQFHRLGHWVVITTNGDVNRRGEAVMGRGVARQAKERLPGIAKSLGAGIKEGGNGVQAFIGWKVLTMPVKRHWWERADLELIADSCRELQQLPTKESVFMPKPGCGNGQLDWGDVEPVLDGILDSRFYVVEYTGKGA